MNASIRPRTKPHARWMKSMQGWSWVITVTWMVIANLWAPFGLFGLVCMFTPIILALSGWGKMSCARICPRGSFLAHAAAPFSFGLTMPKWMHTGRFRFLLWALMMGSFGGLMIWAIPKGIPVIGKTILYFMETATLLALITGILFQPRSWCTICPMGSTSGNLRHFISYLDQR